MSPDSDSQEMELFRAASQTKKVAVGVILIALYAILALLPMSGFIGAAGLSSILSFAICVAPLIGIILGPWRGFGFGLIAGIVATMVSLPIGGGVYLIIPTTIVGPAVAALFTGLSLKRSTKIANSEIPGPFVTMLYLIIVIVLYEIVVYEAWWFMLPYILAAVVSLIFQIKRFEFNPNKSYLQLIPFTFLGAMLDHSMMAMGSVYLLQIPASVFGFVIFPVMLIERTIATLLGALLGFIILKVFDEEISGSLDRET
ncbi:MAG: hypothetical protein AM325_006510 [Candidatus Thorarchaeota archaeon SMTZ1-45]|nr:MAG: hypothetical protein AM325_08255 [Candidatus Thorarchaeota archaeon SMTZ1-45]